MFGGSLQSVAARLVCIAASRGESVLAFLVLRFRRPNHPEQGAGGGVSGGSPQSMVALMVYTGSGGQAC